MAAPDRSQSPAHLSAAPASTTVWLLIVVAALGGLGLGGYLTYSALDRRLVALERRPLPPTSDTTKELTEKLQGLDARLAAAEKKLAVPAKPTEPPPPGSYAPLDKLNELKTTVEGHTQKLASLDTRVTALERRLPEDPKRLLALEGRVISLETRTAAAEKKIAAQSAKSVEDRCRLNHIFKSHVVPLPHPTDVAACIQQNRD